MRQKLLLVAAVFFGILAFVLSFTLIEVEKNKIREATFQRDAIVLNIDLSEGTVIKEEHLKKRTQTYATDFGMGEDILWSKRHDIIGKKMANTCPKAEILTWNSIALDIGDENADGRELTDDIDVEKVAIAIPVDAVSSLNGLIRPQDNVDVVLSYVNPNVGADQKEFNAKTIFHGVRVLACGTDLNPKKVGRSRSYSTITLEVTPEAAKMLIIAQRIGRITLLLRSKGSTLKITTAPEDGQAKDPNGQDLILWKDFLEFLQKDQNQTHNNSKR